MRKNCLKLICFLLCILTFFSALSLEAFARDDNPSGNDVPEFPTALEVESGEYRMTNNNGTISAAKSPGEILYNFGTISSLQGATVQENCKDATINEALSGTINVNKGSIGLINNTAVVKLNAVDGVIDININKIEQNMGIVKENHSTIDVNRGSIEKVGEAGVVLNHIEGTISENQGTVTVVPDSAGIITVAIIEKNSGTVYVEADADNKSTVKIPNNANRLVVKNGADCIVENNSGTIEVEEGGKCILTGVNTGTLPSSGVVYPEGEYYKLILGNIPRIDIQMISNYKIDGDDIYVLKDKDFSFTIDNSKYSVMWSDDADIHSTNVEFIKSLETYQGEYVDGSDKTVTLHIHTFGSCSPSAIKEDWHEILCPNCGKVAVFEACSGGAATCKEPAKCAKCGQEYGSASTDHSFGEWIITKEAGIGVEGTKYRECSICSYRENGTIPAKLAPDEPKGGENPSPDNNPGNNNENNNENNPGNSIENSSKNESLNGIESKFENKGDINLIEPSVEKVKNSDNTRLKEKVQTISKTKAQDETPLENPETTDPSETTESSETIASPETEGKEEDETASFEKPDSKGKGVKWPIVAGSACLVISISSFAAVRIRKKSKSK